MADVRFLQVLNELSELHQRKSADYGLGEDPLANLRAAEEFGVPAWLQSVIRANDKMTRIKSYVETGSLSNESLEDALLDGASQLALALVLYREQTDGTSR